MADRAFVDTNVLLYSIGDDEAKAARAYEVMDKNPFISVQVLNEFANVALRKYRLDWLELHDALEHVRECCEVLPLVLGVHIKALEIAETNLIGIYDANILAAAELANCDVLYTEDLNHGQRFGRVFVQNPFMAAAGDKP